MEAILAAIYALILGPLPRWVSSLYSQSKMAIAGLKDDFSPTSRLMNKIIDLQIDHERLREYLESPLRLIVDLVGQAMFTIGLIAAGLMLGYLFSLVKEPLGISRLFPALIYALATLSAFSTAKLATGKSPKEIQHKIAHIEEKLVVLNNQLGSIDPVAARAVFRRDNNGIPHQRVA